MSVCLQHIVTGIHCIVINRFIIFKCGIFIIITSAKHHACIDGIHWVHRLNGE